jgi:nucleoside-diphosphate-sugar epimerase
MSILVLGKGLLGGTIVEKTGWDCLYRKNTFFNFSDISSYRELLEPYTEIINCVALVNTYSQNKKEQWDTNYKGVANLCDYCEKTGKKLIHISTSYVYAFSNHPAKEEDVPVHCKSWYGYTKLLSDGYIELRSKNYLIIRTMFRKFPFPFDTAYTNQRGNFDYVGPISDIVIDLIKKGASGIVNVGTSLKSMHDLAKVSKPSIPATISPVGDMPLDTSMDLTKMKTSVSLTKSHN